MILEVLDYADAVLSGERATPPKDLQMAFKIEAHGMPYAGGWLEQPAGMLNRATTALNVYQFNKSWYVAPSRSEWQALNPEGALIVGEALKLRRYG